MPRNPGPPFTRLKRPPVAIEQEVHTMARNRYDMDEVLEDSFDISQLKRLAAYVSPYKEKMGSSC